MPKFSCFNICKSCRKINSYFCCFKSNKKKDRRSKIVSIQLSSSFHNQIVVNDDNESVESDADVNTMCISEELDHYISLWEDSITNYKDCEDLCIKSQNTDVIKNLDLIRNEPDTILSGYGYSDQTLELAQRRKDLLRLVTKLGLLDTDSSKSSQLTNTPNPMHNELLLNKPDPFSDPLLISSTFSSKLSSKWAKRLEEITLTQGDVNLVNNSSPTPKNNNNLIIRPKWPDFLSAITYQVIKRNRVGHRMNRIIKLTEYHLLNIKNGDNLSKVYCFTDFRRILLEDNETVVIVLKSGKELIFISQLAPNIAQQLITRVKIRLQLDKTNFNINSNALSPNSHLSKQTGLQISKGIDGCMPIFSTSVTASIIHNISQDSQASADVMVAFANELKDTTIRKYIDSYNGRQQLRSHDDSNLLISLKIDNDGVTNSVSNLQLSAVNHKINYNILKMNEGSREYLVKTEIQNIIFDGRSPEGNTKNLFIENFKRNVIIPARRRLPSATSSINRVRPSTSTFSRNQDCEVDATLNNESYNNETTVTSTEAASSTMTLLDVRFFIDGMHGHILKKHGFDLAKLLQPTEAVGLTKQIRVDNDVEYDPLLNNRNTLYEKKSINDLSNIDSSTLSVLSFIIFTVVEEATFIPLRQEIMSLLPSFSSTTEEFELQIKKKVYSKRSQLQWGIPEHVVSPFNWNSAIFELSSLESNLTPSMMLNALVRCAKAIYSEYKLAVLPIYNSSVIGGKTRHSVKIDEGTHTRDEISKTSSQSSLHSSSSWGIISTEINEDLISEEKTDKSVDESIANSDKIDIEASASEVDLEFNNSNNNLTSNDNEVGTSMSSESKEMDIPIVKNAFLSADDFVPIFIYVFCQSDIKNSLLSKDLLWNLCHPSQLQGECGYYLTAYESAIEYIQNETPTAEEYHQIENLMRNSMSTDLHQHNSVVRPNSGKYVSSNMSDISNIPESGVTDMYYRSENRQTDSIDSRHKNHRSRTSSAAEDNLNASNSKNEDVTHNVATKTRLRRGTVIDMIFNHTRAFNSNSNTDNSKKELLRESFAGS